MWSKPIADFALRHIAAPQFCATIQHMLTVYIDARSGSLRTQVHLRPNRMGTNTMCIRWPTSWLRRAGLHGIPDLL